MVFKADCLTKDVGLWVECPPWGSFYRILACIYGSFRENHGKLRTTRSIDRWLNSTPPVLFLKTEDLIIWNNILFLTEDYYKIFLKLFGKTLFRIFSYCINYVEDKHREIISSVNCYVKKKKKMEKFKSLTKLLALKIKENQCDNFASKTILWYWEPVNFSLRILIVVGWKWHFYYMYAK